jgi:hypothetical protein
VRRLFYFARRHASAAAHTCGRIASHVHLSRNCCQALSAIAAADAGWRMVRTQASAKAFAESARNIS